MLCNLNDILIGLLFTRFTPPEGLRFGCIYPRVVAATGRQINSREDEAM